MKVLLRDAPGARDFVNLLLNLAEDLATTVTGKPDHLVREDLRQMADNIKRDLTPEIGSEAAAEIADVFCRAVLGEKSERETLVRMGLLL